MKKIIVTLGLFIGFSALAQEHFSGMSTSNRVGIINGVMNPAEFANLSKRFEVNIYGLSFSVANNKIGFSDINSDADFEDLLFQGTDPVDARVDAEILGPGFAMKWKKWGFAFTTKAYTNFNIIDVDPAIGNAIANDNLVFNTTLLNSSNNQRLNGVAYGEVGLSAGRNLFENEKHLFSAGISLKFLFPGTYSNFGLDNLNGQITQNVSGAYLTTNSPATLNIAYSGNLADSFTNFSDYSKSIFGGLNGTAIDIGFNYQWKGGSKDYKVNAGLAFKNLGSMTFKDSNNASTNYAFSTQGPGPLDLSLFDGVDNLKDVETILRQKGYLTELPNQKSFKVKLPAMINLYADFKIIPKIYVSGFLQQKLQDNEGNDQITTVNTFTLTPRFTLGFFEAFLPVNNNEISGTNVGVGLRFRGFYLGSGSIVTALINDSKQADIYTGFRWAFL
ncbi:conjugal transfer protein TraF [Flavobacterium phycosphaerae]|uniref:conjugal transfer protein TraF n=1 Tax=Flavobacterium phycosphaerae TaxID=2697515 RepID=UPI00138A15F8|nr:conjugal transfer protein TraF [Flavobacterium phycosphaerae]